MIVGSRDGLKGFGDNIAKVGQVTDAAMCKDLSYNCADLKDPDRIGDVRAAMNPSYDRYPIVTGRILAHVHTSAAAMTGMGTLVLA